MDLIENGKLLYTLRTAKGMTQKQVADRLGIQPKTVSKWETGHGFPDVSTLSDLADIFGVSERTLLSGRLARNMQETGNMKHTKFYVCPLRGSFTQGIGDGQYEQPSSKRGHRKTCRYPFYQHFRAEPWPAFERGTGQKYDRQRYYERSFP